MLSDWAETSRIFAPGAIACAHSTSMAVSSYHEASACVPPAATACAKLGGSAMPYVASNVWRSA